MSWPSYRAVSGFEDQLHIAQHASVMKGKAAPEQEVRRYGSIANDRRAQRRSRLSLDLNNRRLILPPALKLPGVDVVQLHLAPQRGTANIQQLRHLLYPAAGHSRRLDNRLFLDGAEGET